jgi:DNA-binding transcriptional LysR family regulator
VLPFNFNHLYYFYVVAKHRSFSNAAEELRVSQSAISVQIKQFEASLGHALFHRVKSGAELTESGQIVFQYAEEVFHDVDRLRSTLEALEHQIAGSVTIGTVNSIGIYILPDILKAFNDHYPAVRVGIQFKEPRDLPGMVQRGTADFALLTFARRFAGLASVPLQKHKMFLVAPAAHPLASRDSVSPRELEAFPFIGYEEGMETRMMMDALFRRMRLNIEYTMESSNVATIKHMVMAGLGLSFLPEAAVAGELRQGTLVRPPIPSLFMTQDITLYYKSSRILTPTRREFLQFIRERLGAEGHAEQVRARRTAGRGPNAPNDDTVPDD